MIIATATQNIPLGGDDLRNHVFLIYQKLLNSYSDDDLILLESLGINSVDSRVSMIGINPVVTVTVRDCIVRIQANSQLLSLLKIEDHQITLQHTSPSIYEYRLADKKSAWHFIKLFEKHFTAIPAQPNGIAAFACFSYETIHYIENIPECTPAAEDENDITLILCQSQLTIAENSAEMVTYDFPGTEPFDNSFFISAITSSLTEALAPLSSHSKTKHFTVNQETSQGNYLIKARKALDHIRKGDIYQVQIGQKLQINTDTTPLEVYRRLRDFNPSPYMYLLTVDGRKIIGASPELFLRINHENEVLMRPIAGTLGKQEGRTLQDATAHLRNNSKEVAEHMMLVDLCRNDMYRVCRSDSLAVEGLLEIEEYSHVYHMVTTTKASLKSGFDKYDVVKASFPAGTMTGTPKVSAMTIISTLEDSRRGKYAGALGVLGLGSNYINIALCIRSAIFHQGTYTLRASAGMVSDSDEHAEYRETLHKMGSMFRAITGEEISCHIG